MKEGNPAPPMPTMPASRMRSMISSAVGEERGARKASSCAFDAVMTMYSASPPRPSGRVSMAFTVPATLAWTFAETPPAHTAMHSPRFTVCPASTTGRAGFPACCSRGTATSAGVGMRSGGSCSVGVLCPAG